MTEQQHALGLKAPLVRQSDRERNRVNLDGAAQPIFPRDQMLQPCTEVRGGKIDEQERSEARVKTLVFQQGSLSPRPMEDGDDGLTVFDQIAVHLVQFPFLSRHHHQDAGPAGCGVPNGTPA
ncbi:MAG TPA: hypothetical protein D7I01_03160 [Candidatus Poseidoniales archaeon]|nr:MAG TPA: hypothetical protein D7I01_03160 [Candidatus Poseidoniales archaeon]